MPKHPVGYRVTVARVGFIWFHSFPFFQRYTAAPCSHIGNYLSAMLLGIRARGLDWRPLSAACPVLRFARIPAVLQTILARHLQFPNSRMWRQMPPYPFPVCSQQFQPFLRRDDFTHVPFANCAVWRDLDGILPMRHNTHQASLDPF